MGQRRRQSAAGVTNHDIVYDLGSGSGDIVIEAAKLGATSTGIEFNAALVSLSQRKALAAGVSGLATFVETDFLSTDFSSASVIFLYITEEVNAMLKAKLQAMPTGTRIVSYAFDMGDWVPSKSIAVAGSMIYQWTIGA